MNERLFRGLSRAALLLLIGALGACDENPQSSLRFGTIEVTTVAPTAENVIATSDGWSVKHTKLLVHVSAINVVGLDSVLTASATGQIADLVKPGAKVLLSAPVRKARPWELFSFGLGPAGEESTPLEGVAEPDGAMMIKDGLTIYLESTATKGADVKTLKWGFSSDTLYKECEGELNGAVVKGLIVPPDGTDTAQIVMRGDVFFSDKVDGSGALSFDAIAAADADLDGEVTLEELAAVTLETARAKGVSYDVGDKSEIADLGSYVQTLVPGVVGSFRAKGKCVVEAVPPATP